MVVGGECGDQKQAGDGFHLGAFILYGALCQAYHVFAYPVFNMESTTVATHFTDEETEAEKRRF